MEKWKIAAIVALLGALPAYSYFQSPPSSPPVPEGGKTQEQESEKPAPTPPPYLQEWVGKKPPTFSYPQELWANTKKPLTVEGYKGYVVLLELWRANCQHCQDAAPHVDEYAQGFYPRGLRVIGVHSSADKQSIEYDWNAVKKKMTEMGIRYPVAFDEQRVLFNKFHAAKFPTFIIIDRQGIIRYAHEGMTDELQAELEAALRQILEGKNPVWPPTKAESSQDAAEKFAPPAKP